MTDLSASADTAKNEGGFLDDRKPPLLELKGITKYFSGAQALKEVDFTLDLGEVHILFGENGAGKSTLISIIAGAYRPDAGTFKFRGNSVETFSVHYARNLGINTVFQEFSLVPQLTVEENLFLGAERTRYGLLNKFEIRQKAREVLDQLGFSIDASKQVSFLSRAEQQMIEIAKSFRSDSAVLILDEPTASLTNQEAEQLFALIEKFKAQGVGIIYITHRMNEIRRIGDRITVLRDGKSITTVDASISEEELLQLMTGRVIDQIFPEINFRPSKTMLEVKGLSTSNGLVNGVSMHVSQGEIVGMAGLVGSGKSEVARACYGISQICAGKIIFEDCVIDNPSPRLMLDLGLFYTPSDRRKEGLMMTRNARENMTISALSTSTFSRSLILRRRKEVTHANQYAKRLNIQPDNVESLVDHFSGGNQQKILLAKSLTRKVKIFIFDEPTVGVDVGTRVAIYQFIAELCENGAAILLISSDLPEILHLTHRVYVMRNGSLSAELQENEINQESVLRYCFSKEAA